LKNLDFEKVDLNILSQKELVNLKNLSCSPMSFATKILFRLFKPEELHGHNVSGKTLNRNMKAKLPLDPIRVGYIKFLVESWYDDKEFREMLSGTSNKGDLWKSCHTAINKAILISERKASLQAANRSTNNGDDEMSMNMNDGDDSALKAELNSTELNGNDSQHAESDVYTFKDHEEEESTKEGKSKVIFFL
jgi:hypothetical protein